ncbi:hypothetical protein [Fredinandcohnia sp. 179-A 10B2 NHS]|uniref:hypothetical protein n=1 Tax=Fredinandcohnia sp. 179-A 10B2 NHS TaxID=3235176 RepID=UPI0039A20A26
MQLVPAKFREPLSNFNLSFNFYEKETLRTFFVTFRLKCYFLLLLSPIGLGASAYIAHEAFQAAGFGTAVGLLFLSLLLLLPWTLVPVLFLFISFPEKKWQRILSWVYVGILLISYIYWLTIF